MRVYLCRHAQKGKKRGISRLGKEQSSALARFLAGENIQVLYSSDLSRASETAKVVGEALNLGPQISPKLREIAVSQKDWREYVKNHHPDFDYHPGGGESIKDLLGRVKEAWKEIVRGSGGKSTVVVCHGIFIKALLYSLGYQEHLVRNDHVANTGVTILECKKGKTELVEFNYYGHLPPSRPKRALDGLIPSILRRS